MGARELLATDETFREVADLLFGDGGTELANSIIRKSGPDQSELHVNGAAADRKKRRITAGLSAVGATAGAAGLGYAGLKTGQSYKVARAVKGVSRLKAAGQAVKHEKFGAALLPLEVAGLGGEVMATRILHGDSKKKVNKNLDIKRQAQLKAIKIAEPQVKKGTGKLKRVAQEAVLTQTKVQKNADFDVKWEGEFSKVDSDKRQVFGWASIVELNGEPVVDLQGDYISIDEVEKAAYSYVHKSRKGGDMHLRDGQAPVHKSDMIESFVVTPEKKKALGLPEDTPTGWWVGYQVNDDELWSKVKSGERTGFSIHGRGRRSDV
jgi:hypothetical protein